MRLGESFLFLGFSLMFVAIRIFVCCNLVLTKLKVYGAFAVVVARSEVEMPK